MSVPDNHSPAMATSSSLFHLILFLVFFSFCLATKDRDIYHEIDVAKLLPTGNCSQTKAVAGNSLKVTHRHGPCSPLSVGKLSLSQRLTLESRRVSALQMQVKVGASFEALDFAIPAVSGDAIGSADYVVTVSIGTPKKAQTVILDTGSSVSWFQCQPCLGYCYKQRQPIFNPSASSSYRNVSCETKTCRSLSAKACSGETCLYFVRYGDNSLTVGFLGTEVLTITPSFVFKSFIFGCGERNQGLFSGVAGLLGLGRGPVSLVSQVARRVGSVFSYCLPGQESSLGHLTIGNSNKVTLPKAVYTPMLTHSQETSLYYVNLTGISVAGHLIPMSPTTFKSGTIIDSGTVITRLPHPVYIALRRVFRNAMLKFTLADPVELFDTCYDLSKVKRVSCPAVVLHYEGANVSLDASGVLLAMKDSQFCLAFAANKDPNDVAIIGNVQQRGMEVIYDLGAKRVGFAPGRCG
ncbi:aspartyl protease family protein At5g10770-like [Wolffia australiana]